MRISDWSSDVCSSDLLPIGFSGSRRPARLSLIALDSTSIATLWPNTTRLRSVSRLSSTFLSSLDTDLGGMRAIVALTASISLAVIVLRRFDGGTRARKGVWEGRSGLGRGDLGGRVDNKKK